MPVVACLHHLERPFLGTLAAPLARAGIDVDERDLRAGDRLPALDSVDGIVSLGGDQSACELDRHPFLRDEVALLRAAAERGVPVLGVCLGAQLLAAALGAAVHRTRRRTVAWLELSPLPAVDEDPLFARVPFPVPALHWNEDVFDLPAGAVELLERRGEGVEAFRYGPCAWGVQFHPDVDREALDGWYGAYGEWLPGAGVTEQAARAADAAYFSAQERFAGALFGAWANVVVRVAAVPRP